MRTTLAELILIQIFSVTNALIGLSLDEVDSWSFINSRNKC